MRVNDELLFTIITPVFNGEKFIDETIRSVLKSTHGISFEYIVIDDGSSDSTPKILQKYANQITVISQENSGEARAVNSGLRKAKGRFCLIISADDLLVSNELFRKASKLFDENPTLAVVYPDWQIIDERGNTTQNVVTKEFSQFELLGKFNCLPGPGSIFRRDYALSIGGRNSTFKYVSDYDFWLRMSEIGEFKRISGFYAQWRAHDESTSVASRGSHMSNERIDVVYKHLSNFPKSAKLERSAKAAAIYNAAILAFFSKEIPGRKLFFKALCIGRMQIPGAKLKILIYLSLLPVSRGLVSQVTKHQKFKKFISK